MQNELQSADAAHTAARRARTKHMDQCRASFGQCATCSELNRDVRAAIVAREKASRPVAPAPTLMITVEEGQAIMKFIKRHPDSLYDSATYHAACSFETKVAGAAAQLRA